jgi:hypothetical protein
MIPIHPARKAMCYNGDIAAAIDSRETPLLVERRFPCQIRESHRSHGDEACAVAMLEWLAFGGL